jgi:glycine oxidase ThiO
MSLETDVLVMGGGAIGLATALELAWQGAKVTVLSRNFGEAALHAAAGMLAPQAEALPPGPMLDLCLRSRSLYPAWVERLETLTGLDCGYWNCGILAPVLAEGGDSPFSFGDAMRTGRLCQRSPALPLTPSLWLDSAAIQQHQPGLSQQIVGGWWFPADAQVDNQRLAKVLRVAAEQAGVIIHENVSVEEVQCSGQQVTRVSTTAGQWQATTYILATGAWSGQILPIPVTPRKGQMLSVQMPVGDQTAQLLRQVVFGDRIYLVPRQDGRVIVGATSEQVGFTPGNTPAGVRSLLDSAIALYPPLRDWPIQDFWWGFRPTTPDEWPILGASPYRNLILATGHHRNGILLTPITARLIADLVVQQKTDPLLKCFHWSRLEAKAMV